MLQLTADLHLQGELEFPEGVPYFLRIFLRGDSKWVVLGTGQLTIARYCANFFLFGKSNLEIFQSKKNKIILSGLEPMLILYGPVQLPLAHRDNAADFV